jgi:GNAT superfamily N-acetyltransferase
MITYKQEPLSLAENEVTPLAVLEWEESGHPTEDLNIAWEDYFRLEDHGQLKFFTARDSELLVGYFVVLITAPFTSKHSPIGYYEAVYVHKNYRKSTVAKRLFSFVEGCMKDDGILRVIASSSSKNPIGKFLTRMGYNEIETKYEKVL